MNLSVRCIVNIAIFVSTMFCMASFFTSLNVMSHSKRIAKIESYLTHYHSFDASKELGFYKPFDGKDGK